MADYYADYVGGGESAPAAGKPIGTMANWIGAAVSLALIGGVVVWGYQMMVRDVSGVPVVRAAEGPMRVQPESPGGLAADYQGLAVNAVAAEGVAAGPVDRLTLAPAPVDLSAEDAPRAALAALTAAATPARPAEPVGEDAPTALAQPPEPDLAETVAQPVSASVQSLVDQLTAGATPLAATGPAPIVAAPAPQIVPAAAPTNGLARSLRPLARPAGIAARPVSAAAPARTGPRDIDPDAIPAGTRLAQLGAYESPDVAKQEWDRLQARFGDYMAGKDRVIQRAQSGGRTFYRLRAMGFADLGDARRFCAAFVAEKADCIPVVTR